MLVIVDVTIWSNCEWLATPCGPITSLELLKFKLCMAWYKSHAWFKFQMLIPFQQRERFAAMAPAMARLNCSLNEFDQRCKGPWNQKF